MRIVRDYLSISETDRGAVVAIGNFDGVHLGHQMVIEQARRKAREHGAPLGIVTFEPHPRIFFRPADRSFQLMNVRAKVRRFDELRVEVLYMLRFDRTLAECTEDRFVREILAGKLGIKGAVVGQDFRFGKGREGTADSLAQLGKRCAIDVSIAPILEKNGSEYSSSAVRLALVAGDLAAATEILGRWHRIEGVVRQGEKRGRKLGYPTANIAIETVLKPTHGVYAVFVDVLTGKHKGRYKGVASIGSRPTFGNHPPNLEAYILDFEADIYGEEISVALVEFQRQEFKFSNVAELVQQMKRDCIAARQRLDDVC